MADYLDILRSAISLGGLSPLPSEQVNRLLETFRGRGNVPSPAAPPAAPTESGQPARAPSRATAPAPAPAPEPQPAAQPRAGQQSLLDLLRERTSQEISGSGLRTAGDIGAGMLASGSPNFFTMLGAGLRSAQAGEQQRTRDLREAAAAEAEQAYRQRMLELKEEELRDPSVRALREAQAYYYRQRPGMGGGALTPTVLARLRDQARSRAITALRNNPLATPAEIDALTQQYFEEAVQAAGGEVPAVAPSAAQPNVPTINPAGRPTR